KLSLGDATDFDAFALFGRDRFDRIFVSYALSMIPGWERAVAQGLECLAPGGSLHIVDFGDQAGRPHWFRSLLRAWLARFPACPRDTLHGELTKRAALAGMSLEFTPLYRGYAVHAVVRKPRR